MRREVSRRVAVLKGSVETPILRARRGWAPRDVWALDHHLCQVLAGMLDHLATTGHGWPESEEFPTYEDFTQAVRAGPRTWLATTPEKKPPTNQHKTPCIGSPTTCPSCGTEVATDVTREFV